MEVVRVCLKKLEMRDRKKPTQIILIKIRLNKTHRGGWGGRRACPRGYKESFRHTLFEHECVTLPGFDFAAVLTFDFSFCSNCPFRKKHKSVISNI
jgi:hypothetical protein